MDSEAIKLYIKDAPLKAMSKVALEALAKPRPSQVTADPGILQAAIDRASRPESLLPKPSGAELRESGLPFGRAPSPE